MQTVLIANRGAVAARVQRTLRRMGLRSVVVYSEADRDLPYVAEADAAYCIGPSPAAQSYLNEGALFDAMRRSGADAVHPGYGFLSENAGFASRVEAAGLTFIGPSPRWIDAMGHKTRARDLMAKHGMPMCRSSGIVDDDPAAIRAAGAAVGYPVLVKPAGGGGGIGMIAAHDDAELVDAVGRARALAQRSFGNGDVYLEQLFQRPRHIEFQIVGDRHGNVQHLLERDCSVQRRHQKVIEEACAPGLPPGEADEIAARVARLLGKLGYDVIGTVEMLRSADGSYSFLEMNTRLQVEHAVTEAITGLDLVEAQIRLAAGETLRDVLPSPVRASGHAIELRIYAEDPVRFFPSPGTLQTFRLPSGTGIRVETGYAEGNTVSPYYDPMIAKLIINAADRQAAIEIAERALAVTEIIGVKTNIPLLQRMLAFPAWRVGELHTGLVQDLLACGEARM
ncbi:biotin carboxylase AccC (plasmid) [Cupriavidus necator N-1]|uniref:Biotin carboxylase AccC n=1 Tax=Cupriavidus necator (strain ATCC 43291 / DSM 13513 / CCUG 52238 / LMG 8453 / N-1) TaxID=1042878 RepID=F8GYI0_CUPNN|nr:biotin carboxylase N-terminal domain-containing protein [Cupriavidus necator]AEI82921.1 biotin carboxylase AccC [Cupriavidus necator N-1]MDX6008715.1 biotin carboxylase N-terminal domain-containing protein [Cupriavidus necator]